MIKIHFKPDTHEYIDIINPTRTPPCGSEGGYILGIIVVVGSFEGVELSLESGR